jgi:hypothetical protein
LNVVSISIPLEGNYTNIVNFVREIESSETFYLITSIGVEASSQPGGARGAATGGAVGLTLNLEAYFYQ